MASARRTSGTATSARAAEARLGLLRRERFFQPVGDDRSAEIVDAAMVDREAELGIGDARPRRRPSPSTTTSRRLTFCRQFIRAVFSWPTKQPLVKLTPFSSAALHSSQRRSPSSARPSQTPRRRRCSSQPVAGSPAGAEPAAAERGQARIGHALVAVRRPMHRERVVALDRDRRGAGDRATGA